MAEFTDRQKKYTDAKKTFEVASKEHYLARQQLIIVEQQINDFLKHKLLAQLPANNALAKQRISAVKSLTDSQAKLLIAQKALTAAREDLSSLGAASQTMANLNDGIPVLLIPLKLQTRFLTIKHIARNIPDELLVDINKISPAHREMVTSVFGNLKPSVDPLQGISSQAAMLSSSVSPVATTLINVLNQDPSSRTGKKRWQKTEDSKQLCVRIFPDDIYLQTHETAITTAEQTAAKTFWQRMWDAERTFRKEAATPAAIATRKEQQLAAWKQLRFECLSHRASWLVRIMRPAGYPDGFSNDLVTIPANKFPGVEIKSDSWTIAPVTELLPEQFTLKVFFKNPDLPPREITGLPIPDYVQMGFDPDEKELDSFSEKQQTLELPKGIRWLTDLEEAEKCGMAIRMPLSMNEFNSGIAKLVVLGVKTGSDANEGGRLVTRLFDNHHYRPDGMAFLPQGTATNNLPGRPAGFSNAGLSDEATFNLEFPVTLPDPLSDSRRFVTALGLDAGTFNGIFDNEIRDAEEALQINKALWPGTMGYYLDNLMRPNLTDTDIAFTKNFFQRYVTARGLLPSFRVGKQPYGIVPATAWQSWQPAAGASAEEMRLVAFLKKMDAQWTSLTGAVKTMKKVFENTDEQTMKREFRELLAVQASSTRYFRRLVAGEYLLWNTNNRNNPPGVEKAGILTNPAKYKTILEGAGGWNAPVNPRPRILGKFMDDENYKLTDTAPEDAGVETPLMPNGKNYLGMLLDATTEQLKSNVWGEDFGKFVSQRSSRLVFYMARFAYLQEWINAATAVIKKEKPVLSPFARLDFEMEYVFGDKTPSSEHKLFLAATGTAGTFETRKNKWAFFEEILANGKRADETIAQQLKNALTANDPLNALQEVKAALTALSDIPVHRLERLFSEHIDTCSFRLDAWLQGLVLSRLEANRIKPGQEKGIYIGAYGYLENLVPSTDPWIQVKEIANPQVVDTAVAGNQQVVMPVYDFSFYTPQQLATVKKMMFVYLGSDATTFLSQDANTKQIIQLQLSGAVSNGGFILTPSLEHAATASILRAGYEHHALSQGPESTTLAVNIDATRTGLAMDMMKAVNAGHSLNEQLGYFIERKMYDGTVLAQFVPALRAAFPLHIERNEWDDDQKINEADKVSNLALVTDGLAIVNKNQQPQTAPTWNDKLTAIFGADQNAKIEFGKIVDQAKDQFDAIGDIVLAESVFQMVKGSPERAAAALRITSDASDIILPEVTQVPSETRLVTHRMGFVLNATGNLEKAWPATDTTVSVFARMSPALNRWLADQLPAPDKIVVKVFFPDKPAVKVNLKTIGLQPIDFYYLLQKTGGRPQESLLAWLFAAAARKQAGMGEAIFAEVSFKRETGFGAAEFAVRELMPLIKSIGWLLEKSRPMRPADWQLPSALPADAPAYDNTHLRDVCEAFAGDAAASPVPVFLKKLNTACKALEDNMPAGFVSVASAMAYSELLHLVPQAFTLGFWDATPRCPDVCNPINAKLLLDHASQVAEGLTKRLQMAGSLLSAVAAQPATTASDKIFDDLVAVARVFAGEDFLVLPAFHVPKPAEIKATLANKALTTGLKEFETEEWLQGLSMVHENVRNYQLLFNLREVCNAPATARRLRILQLPFVAGAANAWVGGIFPPGFTPPPAATSMAFEFSANFVPAQLIAGIVIDDWREKIPLPAVTAGAAIHYNEADSEAPQCLLLAVAPEQKGAWDWNMLLNTVLETMTMAKKRAVDTEILQTTWLNQFLPAVINPIDAKNNTPNNDFKWCGPAIKTLPTVDMGGLGHFFTKL